MNAFEIDRNCFHTHVFHSYWGVHGECLTAVKTRIVKKIVAHFTLRLKALQRVTTELIYIQWCSFCMPQYMSSFHHCFLIHIGVLNEMCQKVGIFLDRTANIPPAAQSRLLIITTYCRGIITCCAWPSWQALHESLFHSLELSWSLEELNEWCVFLCQIWITNYCCIS